MAGWMDLMKDLLRALMTACLKVAQRALLMGLLKDWQRA